MPVIEINLKDDYTVIPINNVSGFDISDDVYKKSFLISEKDPLSRLIRILSICFSSRSTFSPEELSSSEKTHQHIVYLANYLLHHNPESGFQVKTIVIEHKYVSLSFLKDYANYYSKGYNNIQKYCKRIHFFENEFNNVLFEQYLLQKQDKIAPKDDFSNYYYGHVVIKPLQNSLIGATLLRCYTEFYERQKKQGLEFKNRTYVTDRSFPAIRNYQINLFGKTIEFESLVFQQQDRAISACATVALWMSFHKTSHIFRTKLPAPSEITKSAGLNDSIGRFFPSNGLQTSQIIKAIDCLDEDIISEVFQATDWERVAIKRQNVNRKIVKPWKIKRYLYAYLQLHTVPLLGYNVIKLDGNHLVAVTGYRKERKHELSDLLSIFPPQSETGIRTEADRVQRFFCHDDQLGPFAKIGFKENGFSKYIKVNWTGKSNHNLAIPSLIVVPLSDTIRVDYNQIEIFAEKFQQFLTEINSYYKESTLWDINIQKSNQYKKSFENSDLPTKLKVKYLGKSFPQYIWVASLSILGDPGDLSNQNKTIDFIFDATDTPKSMNLFEVVYYNQIWMKNLYSYYQENREGIIKKYTNLFRTASYLNKIESSLQLQLEFYE